MHYYTATKYCREFQSVFRECLTKSKRFKLRWMTRSRSPPAASPSLVPFLLDQASDNRPKKRGGLLSAGGFLITSLFTFNHQSNSPGDRQPRSHITKAEINESEHMAHISNPHSMAQLQNVTCHPNISFCNAGIVHNYNTFKLPVTRKKIQAHHPTKSVKIVVAHLYPQHIEWTSCEISV